MATGLATMARAALASMDQRLETLAGQLLAMPGDIASIQGKLMAGLASGEGVRAMTSLMIVLFIGAGLEWFYWSYATGPFTLIETMPVRSPRHALALGLRRALLALIGLLIFVWSVLIVSTGFAWAPGLDALLVGLVLVVATMRLGWIVIDLVLAPHRPHLALVELERQQSWRVSAVLLALATLAAFAAFIPDVLIEVAGAPNAAAGLRFIAATLSLPLIIGLGMGLGTGLTGSSTARGEGRFTRLRLPRFPRWFLPGAIVMAIYVVWLVEGGTLAAFLALVVLLILAQRATRPFVLSLWRDRLAAPAATEIDPLLMPNITIALVRLALTALMLGLAAIILDIPLEGMANGSEPAARFIARLLQVAAFLILAHVTWSIIRSGIDHRLALIGPVDPHGEPGPNARLLTLLPLLRTTAAVVIVTAVVLSSLWALGIEITPLLAGAGVVGLALGFGAQALVRDVIAGVFYLAEDVFRIGEYIESGPSTKGTVEHITLRTVALRHHNGPLHFVPYGALGTVRNTSRDWVIDKFNLPLPVDVDSERVRKIIKKVGEEMLADPEVGPLIVTPLKGKLYRVDPGVKLFRCRFETAPGKQFDVRADAYKRIEAKLKEAGIGFANSTPIIVIPGSGELRGGESLA